MWTTHNGLLLRRSWQQSAADEDELGGKNRMEAKSQTVGSHKSTWCLCCTFLKIAWSSPAWSSTGGKLEPWNSMLFSLNHGFHIQNIFFFKPKPHGKTSSTTSHRSKLYQLSHYEYVSPVYTWFFSPARFFSRNDLKNVNQLQSKRQSYFWVLNKQRNKI